MVSPKSYAEIVQGPRKAPHREPPLPILPPSTSSSSMVEEPIPLPSTSQLEVGLRSWLWSFNFGWQPQISFSSFRHQISAWCHHFYGEMVQQAASLLVPAFGLVVGDCCEDHPHAAGGGIAPAILRVGALDRKC